MAWAHFCCCCVLQCFFFRFVHEIAMFRNVFLIFQPAASKPTSQPASLGPGSEQNQSQKSRFADFLALTLAFDKISPKSLDLMTLRPWPQKSTKSIPEVSTCWLSGWAWPQKSTKSVPDNLLSWFSGIGSGSRKNHSQKSRLNDFECSLALAPEIDKIIPRCFD